METAASLTDSLRKDLAKQKILAAINTDVCEVFSN